MSGYTVSKLAQRVGTSPDTLRYYEKIGLIPPPGRTPSGYRLYGDDAVVRMQFIKGAQRLGLRLDEIAELLAIRERGLCPCGHTQKLLNDKLRELEMEIDSLLRLREEIVRMLESGGEAEPAADGSCTECAVPLIQIGQKPRGAPAGSASSSTPGISP